MNDQALVDTWQKENERFLLAAMHWLHLRLRALAGPTHSDQPGGSPAGAAENDRNLLRVFTRRRESSPVPPERLLGEPGAVTPDQIERAAEEMMAAAEIDPAPALLTLAQRFGLMPFEQYTLLLAAGPDLDPRTAELCARATAGTAFARPYPTFALALDLFENGSPLAFSPDRPLRYWQMLEISQPAGQALITSALRVDERIVNYLRGVNYIDDRLLNMLAPLDIRSVDPLAEDRESVLSNSQLEIVDRIISQLRAVSAAPGASGSGSSMLPVVQLLGGDSLSKQLVAVELARRLGLQLFQGSAGWLPTASTDLESFARLWQREGALLPLAMYIDAADQPLGSGEAGGDGSAGLGHLRRLLERSAGLYILDIYDPLPGLKRPSLAVDVARPSPAEQVHAWQQIGGLEEPHAAHLAAHFNLNLPSIRQAARAAGTEKGRQRLEIAWQACLSASRPRLSALAQRIDALATWEDIVLPENELALLRMIAAQVEQRHLVYDTWGFRSRMNRGLGISALFAGESGTGKTMAAEVIANELRLNLYRIDLSAVVSKYIGETEKNLRRVFDAAEDGGVILFFDEADALFGKRSEVKDSHDRYANIEINYLLQRMEAYSGLAVLATNMKAALDPAFLRRLRFVVNFPFPGQAERRQIWERAFTPQTRCEALDYEHLARFNLAGGSIHNIALSAAFMAAHRSQPVSMPLVLEALRVELRKLEKPVNETELRWNGAVNH